MRHPVTCVVLMLVLAGVAAAADQVRPTRIEVVPNFHAASVYAFFEGDDNASAVARLEYRTGDAKDFRPGHPLSRTGKGRFAGSIFYLQPDQPLDVRVTLGDPDGLAEGAAAALTASTRTRRDVFPAGAGKAYYVALQGDDADPGTKEKPFRTIQHAVGLAEGGDTIYLAGGSYPEGVRITRSGRPDAYIMIRPDPEAAARLVGWVAAPDAWEQVEGDLYAFAEDRPVGAATMTPDPPGAENRPAGTRLYHHVSLEDLKKADAALLPGWWQDAKAGRVYVRRAEGRPAAHTVGLGVLRCGLAFEDAGYWVIEGLGFELFGGGPYGRGIDIVNSHDIVVRNCRFDVMRTGVAIRKPRSANCLVERCTFRDNGIFDWPWKAVKAHDTEGSAISLSGAGGNVVRHNTIRGWFNGVDASTWGDLENETLNRDLDIHDNVFTQIGDDPLEPEGACMNVRFWHNRSFDTLQGISLAPITVGPTYVVRDRYVNYKGGAVKVSVSSRGVVYLYHILGYAGRTEGNGMGASGPWDNMHFRNSILRGTRYVIEDFYKHPIGCSVDYCCLYTTDAGRFIKWADTKYANLAAMPAEAGFGSHNVAREPYATLEDGQPKDPASELIDAGVRIPGINDDFRGQAPDIGPDEVR